MTPYKKMVAKKAGNPEIIITDEQRQKVEYAAGLGLRDEDIAILADLKEKTMQRHCKVELKRGRTGARAKLANTAMLMALSGKEPAMTIFMAKTQLQWRETDRPTDRAVGKTQIILKGGPKPLRLTDKEKASGES